MDSNTNKSYAEKRPNRIVQLKNGYVLEYGTGQEPKQWDRLLVFSSFFNPFKRSGGEYQIIQTIRDGLTIRHDKMRGSIIPVIDDIRPGDISEENLFKLCFSYLEKMVAKETFPKGDFSRTPLIINDLPVQDYFLNTLSTVIVDPEFRKDRINRLSKYRGD